MPTTTANTTASDDVLSERPDLDFSNGERGKHTKQESAQDRIHMLLRRSLRVYTPTTPEEDADRAEALKRLNKDAAAYYEWKEIEDQAKREASALKPSIHMVVDKIGTVPDAAPKSRRVETESFVCTITTGATLDINDEMVLSFDLAMNTKSLRAIFDALFVRRVEYTLSPTAQQMMEHGKLPKAHEEVIRAYYSRCFSAKTTTPSLSIESKAALEQKRLDAVAAAEAKAAKKKSGKAAA